MLKTTVENYKKAKSIYKEIDDKFSEHQQDRLDKSEFQINQILNRLNDFEKHLRYIQLDDLDGNYPSQTIDAVKHNTEVFQDALYYWKRFFLGSKYAIGLKDPITLKYVPGLNLESQELDKWGGEEELAKKIIGTLISDLYVTEYEKSIKRMILGTMLQKEFNRIFDVIKHKMIVSPKKFISIDKYKLE